ncbi:MAG: LacI family transcriptional regulator [Spirochaetaceae bacterium]|jgi:LacI family transcriptional regulator|nr:LacI family transcriptional regulator [Spirochaetaceae bacterium]
MTVHEIAALAGVSIGTVDRVLHRRGRVSAATRARIEAIIEQHQFIPNPIARSLKRKRPYRFCALIPRRDHDAGFWGQILAGIERAAAEIKPLGVETEITEFDRYDFSSFRKSAETATAQKPDGLLFAPIMPERTKPFVEKVLSEKIPLVFVDSEMPGINPLCVIAQDPFKGGYLAGRLFHLFAGTVAKPVAVLNVHGEDYHITKRRDGFLSYAKDHGFPVLVREYSDYDGVEISSVEIGRFLKEQPELSGLFITNCMAYRAAAFADGLRKNNGPFFLLGYDLIPKNLQLLREGKIDAIISQHPEEQGREALFTLFRRVALGQTVEARRDIPLDVYIRENAPAE